MRRLLFIMFLLLPTPFFGRQSPVREIPLRSVPDFLKLPTDLYLGEVSGVAVNSKGQVFVSSRSGTTGPAYPATAAQLSEFGPDGKFIREIEHNFLCLVVRAPVRIDKQDNIWVTHGFRYGHQAQPARHTLARRRMQRPEVSRW